MIMNEQQEKNTMNFTFNFFDGNNDDKDDYNDVGIENNNNEKSIDDCNEIMHDNINVNEHEFTEFELSNNLYYQSIKHHHSGLDEKSDLIPGRYEGGYKLWECSNDLVKYLLDDKNMILKKNIKNQNVLELGCGHGFPGITALKIGYSKVIFSDMNREVIEQTTWPNIIKNSNNNSNYDIKNCKCYSGDWTSLSLILKNENDHPMPFSLILSAETLYTSNHCKKIFDMLNKHLDKNGLALIATKKYYFGVRGGSMELEQLIKNNDQLTYQIVSIIEDKQSNIREIIQITKKS